MIFKKSIINIFRSKAKSSLFFALILALTIVLSLGISVWVSVDSFLQKADETYTTIGLFEYMGPEYPNEDIYDKDMQDAIKGFDYASIENNENVLFFEKSQRALGYVDGFNRNDKFMPRKDYAVFFVTGMYLSYGRNNAEVSHSLYSTMDISNQYVRIVPIYYYFAANYEEGHNYIVHGMLLNKLSRYKAFGILPFTNGAAQKAGIVDGENYMVVDITTEDGGYEIPDDSIFYDIAETYRVVNNSVNVYMVEDINSN